MTMHEVRMLFLAKIPCMRVFQLAEPRPTWIAALVRLHGFVASCVYKFTNGSAYFLALALLWRDREKMIDADESKQKPTIVKCVGGRMKAGGNTRPIILMTDRFKRFKML